MHCIYRSAMVVAMVLFCFTGSSVLAQTGIWAPPEPSFAEGDWIRLTSGEWLWGSIELMRDESLDFDSEELDDLSIDWEDISEIRSARVMTYVLLDKSEHIGTAAMKDGLFRVETTDGVHEFSSTAVHSILEGVPRELNFWSARVGADWKIFSGNTNQSDFGARVFLKREAARSRVDLRYQGFVSVVDEIETINNHRVNTEYKMFLSRKFFLTPIKAELYADKFKNIDLRLTASVGAGYFISRNSTADWYVEAGVGVDNTSYLSVQPGEDNSVNYASLPFRTTLETDLTNDIELTAEYGIQVGTSENANTTQHASIIFDLDLIGDLEFTASFTWDHISNPKENADGETPQKSDLIMAYGLSYDF